MFDKQRYLTRGVKETIPLEIQLFMWYAISTLKVEKDYLQVFDLSIQDGMQKIVHTQEVPEYTNTYLVQSYKPVDNVRVFVIDDGDYSTMLLAEEY